MKRSKCKNVMTGGNKQYVPGCSMLMYEIMSVDATQTNELIPVFIW